MKTSEVLVGSALLGAAGAAYYFLVYRPFKAGAAKAQQNIDAASAYAAGNGELNVTDDTLNSLFWINVQNNSQPGGRKQLVVPKRISPWFKDRNNWDTGLQLHVDTKTNPDKTTSRTVTNNVWEEQFGTLTSSREILFTFSNNGQTERWIGFPKISVYPSKDQAAKLVGSFRSDLVNALNSNYQPGNGTWSMGDWIGKIFSVSPPIFVMSKRHKTYDEIQTYINDKDAGLSGLRSMGSLAGVYLR